MVAVPIAVELNVTEHTPPVTVVQLGVTVPRFVENDTTMPDWPLDAVAVIVDA